MKRTVWAGVVLILLLSAIVATAHGEEKALLKFEENESLDAIRAKIAHNGYSFTVGHNWVYDLPPVEKAALLSRHPSRIPIPSSDDIGPLEKHLGKALPASFDWRSKNGHAYIGPIRDQGTCGACYAFAASATAESSYNILKGLVDGSCVDFSEAFIAWCLGGMAPYNEHFSGCAGTDYDYQELQALVDQGIPNESVFPYSDADPQTCPGAAWNAPRVKYGNWYRVTCGDIGAIKTAIYTYGVVDAAVYAGGAFTAYSGGIYNDTNTTCYSSPCDYTPTNHAIALAGWDDSPPEGGGGCWILRNSWGTTWGESGYMRIRYDAALVACEVAYLAGPYDYTPPTPTIPPSPTPTPVPPTATPIVFVPFNIRLGHPVQPPTGILSIFIDVMVNGTSYAGVPCLPYIAVNAGGKMYYIVSGNKIVTKMTPYMSNGKAKYFQLYENIVNLDAASIPLSGLAPGRYWVYGALLNKKGAPMGSIAERVLTIEL